MTARQIVPGLSSSQTALEFLAGTHLITTAIDMFVADCLTKNLSGHTVKFYRSYLHAFAQFAASQAADQLEHIDAALLRIHLAHLTERHNPGGVHCAYRSIRAFLRWVEREELMPADWRNPITKVAAPRVPEKTLEPIPLEAVASLLGTCKGKDIFSQRDRAVFLFLLDTGVRAQELCDVDLSDVELTTGEVVIRHGKGDKARAVFIGRQTSRALRGYLRSRKDSSPGLFASRTGERLSYDGLRQILERRAKKAGLKTMPTLHSFRRAFALDMLRDGTNIYALQRLMGHADTQVLNRYLALTSEDLGAAHRQHSPVDRRAWA